MPPQHLAACIQPATWQHGRKRRLGGPLPSAGHVLVPTCAGAHIGAYCLQPTPAPCLALPAAQVDQRVFKQLLLGQFPDMCAHLEALGVDVSCVFAQWFLSCFVNALPLESCLRAWDLLFLEGSTLALFRWGAAAQLHRASCAHACC